LAEPYVLFPVVALVLLGVIWGTTASLIAVERASAARAVASSSLVIAETYEAQVVRALREIDQTLKFVQFAHERAGGRIDLSDLKAKGLLLADLLFVVSVTDSAGRVVASTRPIERKTVADQDYFQVSRERDAIAVSRPQLGPDREWKLHFSRRFSAADGTFDGAVIVTVPAAYFVSGYEDARLGNQGVLGLLGTDGVFRARRSGDRVYYDEWINYRKASATGAEAAHLARNEWDGVQRYTSVRELYQFPMAVVVGLSDDEQMTAVHERARTYLLRAAGGSAALILLLGGLGFLSWQLSRTRLQANRVVQAIESSVNAILITDLSRQGTPIEYANPAFEKMTGYSAREAVGRDTRFLLGLDVDQPGLEEIRMAVAERREGHAVLRNYRKDGTLFWNDLTIAPVRSEKGEVTHFVEVMNDVTEAKNYEEQLAHQANFDTLTGLANRNLLQDRLHQAISGARRDGGSAAAVFLDVDNFKVVNDSLGHRVGDEMLQKIAARLTANVREYDTVARLGGDEFVLVLRARDDDAAIVERDITGLVEKLLAVVSQPMELGGRPMRPTVSIGVSLFPHDGTDADTLLRHADAAMYRAKELGRNRFQFFTADVHERIQRRLELHSSLRLALERNEFELHYQPQAGLRGGGQIVGVEALLRWRHPERGLIAPAQFIGFAEETGLIIPIGTWVLNEACRQNKAWQDAGLPKIPVAVNMSAKQCEQADVADVVRDALAASGLDPKYLELEITESISMANPGESVPLLHRLKETGVTLSIDDFGTGFSNLSYLRRFPVDRLKIDLSFVREITTDPGSLAISEAIITMSHSLNLQVVAEGVETHRQLELLEARNCDMVQGYYFSPPVHGAALAVLLGEGARLSYPPAGGMHDAPALIM
jgi:diguanylate cyclase (GGDEF)-like protein/PAS domain S-box-containing protein